MLDPGLFQLSASLSNSLKSREESELAPRGNEELRRMPDYDSQTRPGKPILYLPVILLIDPVIIRRHIRVDEGTHRINFGIVIRIRKQFIHRSLPLSWGVANNQGEGLCSPEDFARCPLGKRRAEDLSTRAFSKNLELENVCSTSSPLCSSQDRRGQVVPCACEVLPGPCPGVRSAPAYSSATHCAQAPWPYTRRRSGRDYDKLFVRRQRTNGHKGLGDLSTCRGCGKQN